MGAGDALVTIVDAIVVRVAELPIRRAARIQAVRRLASVREAVCVGIAVDDGDAQRGRGEAPLRIGDRGGEREVADGRGRRHELTRAVAAVAGQLVAGQAIVEQRERCRAAQRRRVDDHGDAGAERVDGAGDRDLERRRALPRRGRRG
jgi:hypothetical protein